MHVNVLKKRFHKLTLVLGATIPIFYDQFSIAPMAVCDGRGGGKF